MPDDLQVPIAPDDLMEVLGALMENAKRFARRQVRVAGHASEQSLDLLVEDDGPGLNISTEEALSRGGRLDETLAATTAWGCLLRATSSRSPEATWCWAPPH
ncbi:hypothetical protein LJR127_001819 [Pseudoxanthomonas sp. LjRoot127]